MTDGAGGSAAGEPALESGTAGRSFVDLHCHSNASFDSLTSPAALVRAAASRGLTHLAVTDHETIDGALRAGEAADEIRRRGDLVRHGLEVPEIIVGEEVRTRDGDLVCLYLERAVAPGMSAEETVAAVREQGGLVGVPHPFDRFRGSVGRTAQLERLAPLVDWIEGHNARIMVGDGNERAMVFARAAGMPVVAVSDAHSLLEIGVACTVVEGSPAGPADLLAALRHAELVTGRASFFVRGLTPIAKLVQSARGRGRLRPGAGA